jgi:hypothetical protein
LSQHKSDLGTKIVQSVRIWNDHQPCLLFEIAAFQTNVTQDTADDGPTNGRRAVRKSLSARANSWGQSVDKGRALLERLACGDVPPSSFTSHNDLQKWGWTVRADGPADLSPDQRTAVEYLGASYSPTETWAIGVVHDKQVTVDGTVYPPTGGNYWNRYAPEFIISTYNIGPRAAAAEDELDIEDFPELERQSDLMFLEYKRKMDAINRPKTGLKGLIRFRVVNEDTQKIVATALGYNSLHAMTVPQWPGRDFAADSDEFAAIVASPNGRAAPWLLGNKEQLGHSAV